MIHDNFDDWYATQIGLRLQHSNLDIKAASAAKADFRAAWEAGYGAGKLYGESVEIQRQDDLKSLG
jgi:hypothetical protein